MPLSAPAIALIAVTVLVVLYVFFDGLAYMVKQWSREEYSHGYLIPLIAGFMLWRARRDLRAMRWQGDASGLAIVLLALLVYVVGELSTLYTLIQYAFLMLLAGVCVAIFGWRSMKVLWIPLVYLFFMIPLPNFFYHNLSSQLQLISSAIGVWVIRLFDISVFLEGNVIDLGVYQLQVVEACSGLRYLFPLMSFGFLCAYLFKAPWWQRLLVFLSAVPLTVLMNSVRIGIIGVLVEHWGIEQAEGFLHYFEGWIVFMLCVGVMFLLMWVMSRLSGGNREFADVFNVDFGDSVDDHAPPQQLSRVFVASAVAVLSVGVLSQFLQAREEIVPSRTQFSEFPLRIANWRGMTDSLTDNVLKVLKLNDYLLANYVRETEREPVNLYVAYYESQRKGASIHSPRSCLPGNDWEISSLTRHGVPSGESDTALIDVNRVLITKGSDRQLVYYWFEQRGRRITSEYAVKWYLLWDALNISRTDGALVRLTTPVPAGTQVKDAEARLQDFLRSIYPQFDQYVPT